jgi:hypothetical protein
MWPPNFGPQSMPVTLLRSLIQKGLSFRSAKNDCQFLIFRALQIVISHFPRSCIDSESLSQNSLFWLSPFLRLFFRNGQQKVSSLCHVEPDRDPVTGFQKFAGSRDGINTQNIANFLYSISHLKQIEFSAIEYLNIQISRQYILSICFQ